MARTLAEPWGTDPKQRGEPFERPTLPQPIRAPGRPALGCRVPHLRRGCGLYALLHGVPDRLHRGVRLEPGREFHRLLGIAADQRCHVSGRWYPGRSPWAAAPGPDRWRPARGGACRQLVRQRPLAGDPAVWRGDDTRRQLPRIGGVRSDPVAPLRAEPRRGSGGRAVGERLCPGIFGTVVAGVDRRPGLARSLSRAGRVHGGGVSATCRACSAGQSPNEHPRRAGAPSSPPAGRCAARCARRISGC